MTSVMKLFLALAAVLFASTKALVTPPTRGRAQALKPLRENFFIDLPTLNDPSKITPALLNGEANYKTFVERYDPNALLLGGGPYAVVKRVRELELLSKTVDSGLLQALEEKGLTLSQLERALPLIDSAGLLPLLVKNKGLLLGVLPLIVEPAPALLPIVTSVVRTPASSFGLIGATALVVGLLEGTVGENAIVGVLAALLGLPAFVLSAVLGKIGEPLPAVSSAPVATVSSFSSSSSSSSSRSSNRPRVAARRPTATASSPKAPKSASSASVKVSAPAKSVVSAGAAGGSLNGKRKVVRIN